MKKMRCLSYLTVLAIAFSCNKSESNESKQAKSVATVNANSTTSSGEGLVSVDGQVLTETDILNNLKGRAKGQYFKAKADYYEAQQNVLNEYLYTYLVEQYATKKGKSAEEILKTEVSDKIKKVTDKDIQKFYDDFKERAAKVNRPIPPLSDEIKVKIQEQLEGEKREERKNVFFDQLKKEFKIAYLSSPPRMDIATGNLPVKGSANAPITIVEFSDFQCPYCQQGAQTVDKIAKEFKGKVKIYFRDFPLDFHPKAKPAAVAARCAGEQGKFWEFHDKLFAEQAEWAGKAKDDAATTEALSAIAKKLRLKEADFKKCLEGTDKMDLVNKDMADGVDAGVSGTPAFFVNGMPLSGALPFEKFKDVINQELVRTRNKTSQAVLP